MRRFCKILILIISLLGIIYAILAAIIGFAVLPNVVKNEIIKQVWLEDSTEQFERWKEMPFPLQFKVYFFNVENPDDILLGAKPIVKEQGPYVYKEFRYKEDVVRNASADTLSYHPFTNFEFDPVASSPLTEEDAVMVLNVPLYGLFQIVDMFKIPFIVDEANQQWENAFPGAGLFTEIKVKDYLFGGYNFCTDTSLSLCSVFQEVSDEMKTMEIQENGSVLFSFFRFKDGQHSGYHTIIAGMDVVEDLGLIKEWEGTTKLTAWDENGTCNDITGRDSTIYPPFIEQEDKFDIFNPDICRVVTLTYVGEEEYKGIPGQRRQLDKNTFTNEGENQCFCITMYSQDLEGNSDCLPKGFMNLYSCLGAPVIISLPHFLWADEEYSSTIEGLAPVEEDHVSFANIEPNTGTPLGGASRVQFNMILRPIDKIDITQNLPRAMLPLLWIDEGMELSDEYVEELEDKYFSKVTLINVVTWLLIGVGIAEFIGFGALYLYKR